jgi:RraA family protein
MSVVGIDATPTQLPSADEIQQLLERLALLPVANVGDAMDRISVMDSGIRPMWRGARLVAQAYTLLTRAGDNQVIHEAIDRARAGEALVVNGFGDVSRALIGELIAGRAKANGLAGFVIDGAIRDVEDIGELGLPVFARAVTPAGPYKFGPGLHQVPVALGGQCVMPGDVITGDADGVVVIPLGRLASTVDAAELVFESENLKRNAIVASRT